MNVKTVSIAVLCLMMASGCAQNSIRDCDPNVGGLVQGIRCSNGGYADQIRLLGMKRDGVVQDNDRAEKDNRSLEARKRALEMEKVYLLRVKTELESLIVSLEQHERDGEVLKRKILAVNKTMNAIKRSKASRSSGVGIGSVCEARYNAELGRVETEWERFKNTVVEMVMPSPIDFIYFIGLIRKGKLIYEWTNGLITYLTECA